MNVAIIDKITFQIKNVYWSEDGTIDTSRPDVDETVVQSIIPDKMDYWCIKANPDFTIVIDLDKVDAKNTVKIEEIRSKRNLLLASCDWTQTKDAPLSVEKQGEWAQYRQNLRDITLNLTDLDNPSWPTQPS